MDARSEHVRSVHLQACSTASRLALQHTGQVEGDDYDRQSAMHSLCAAEGAYENISNNTSLGICEMQFLG